MSSRNNRLKLAALGAALAALMFSCSSGDGGGSGWDSMDGATVYSKAGCQACHGADGRGFMGLGSSYAGIKQYWDADKLLTYIADPAAFAQNVDRLGKRPMAAIASDVTPAARKQLVEHVLSLMD